MINKVSIRNFKCLRDVQVDLERFTIFVGPNASGKSSILQALDFLCRSFHVEDFFDLDAKVFWNRSRRSRAPIELAADSEAVDFRYRNDDNSSESSPAFQEDNWDENGRGVRLGGRGAGWEPWNLSEHPSIPLSTLLRLEASKLVQPDLNVLDPTNMSPSGEGIHSALATMALNDPDSWQELQTNLRRIIPTIRRLRHTKPQHMHQPALLFDTVGADSVTADQVSEGTLLVLGLLTALHSSERPNLLLMDDLDRGLHPKAQRELITLLRGLLDTNPDLQILATTHSPYMLDCMEVNEVRMTSLKDDGSTVCAPLTSHPKFPKWKDEMTPGEMWSLFGEKWAVEEVTA